ncbi:PEP/pyruvate-binding domain-containing protein [Candidatus Magnetominusculus dajiuhuensis]|uniref:PEP/pyruvate-binding domain-containing protein n=1 Tax=Candidatus Magnetominusculus dajiuhuensis TaxID=3137712 RepID=UPI003B42A503
MKRETSDGALTGRIAFLVELNTLKNAIIAEKDFNEQIKILCTGILDTLGMSRVLYYFPLDGNRLHAAYEFIRHGKKIKFVEGPQVRSSFNPPRAITESERMYLASQNGYYIKLKDKISDHENIFVLVCIKDNEGTPAGYLKVEIDTENYRFTKDYPVAEQPLPETENAIMKRNELFVNWQRELLADLREVIGAIVELSNFITLSTVKDPYCELNRDLFDSGKLRAFELLVKEFKAGGLTERFNLIPELIRLLDAESIRLYSKSSSEIVKTIGVWSKESSIVAPVYKSSFLEGRKIITDGDSIYQADLKGYDVVLDILSNPKCAGMKELTNLTSYIVVALYDTMKKTIGFMQVNYIFRGDMGRFKFHRKLKKDLEILQSVSIYLTAIPESEEFTHNPAPVLDGLRKFIDFLPGDTASNDQIFSYISDTISAAPETLSNETLPELIDNLKKFSYFVRDKRDVINFFRSLYGMVVERFRPLVVSAVTIMFEHFSIEQGKELTVFRGACYDTLAQWMKAEIKTIISNKHQLNYSTDTLEQLLQLNCIFISKYHGDDNALQKCTEFLEAMNINDFDNTDFLFYLFTLNPDMPGPYKTEIFKSFHYLIGNALLSGEKTAEVLALALSTAESFPDDYNLLSQILSTAIIAFNRDGAEVPLRQVEFRSQFAALCRLVLGGTDNWLAGYTAALLLFTIGLTEDQNSINLTNFRTFLSKEMPCNKAAVLSAICDFLQSQDYNIDLAELDGSVRLMLPLLQPGDAEVINLAKEIIMFLGSHIIKYRSPAKSGNFINILINELSNTEALSDINYKLTIHDILYTLKTERIEHQSIHPIHNGHGAHPASPQDSYISAVSSTLGFNPFDVGDKGCHLLEVIGQCSIPVFLLLKTIAYDDFINHNDLKKHILSTLGTIGFDRKNGLERRIIEAGAQIEQLIINGQFPEHMQLELIDKFIKFKDHISTYEHFVTIGARSTAKGEDGRLYSFAGQFLTILDIKTPEEFLRAIKRIWASLWSPKALSYRHDIMEFDPLAKERFSFENLGMGVLIQGVVDCAVSGVIMTSDNGGIVVSGSYGIEGGTRSEIAADKYTIDLHASVTGSIIASQEKAVYWDRAMQKFLLTSIEDNAKRLSQKVSANQLRILFEIVDKLKHLPIFMGCPLDIEYAITFDEKVFVTQIRPKTAVFKESLAQTHNCDFSGLGNALEIHLQTFTFGSARAKTAVLDIDTDASLEKIVPGEILVARHLDLPNLEVYLKRRPPGAIILETCTPFAHPVLVVSEMEKMGIHIPIVQIPGALGVFKNGMDVGINVIRENVVSIYSKDPELLAYISNLASPIVYKKKFDKTFDAQEMNNPPMAPAMAYKQRERQVETHGLDAVVREAGELELFKELYTLSLYRRVEIENLIGGLQAVDDEDIYEWYTYILQQFHGRPFSQYNVFKAARIAPSVKKETIAAIEEKIQKNTLLIKLLEDNFNNIRAENLWHPREIMFQMNSPVFIVDPKIDSADPRHNPEKEEFNPWEFKFFAGAQDLIFHDQLGTLVAHKDKAKYIRGRVAGAGATRPESSIDLGFLDNTGSFYDTFEKRVGALSKLAAILLRLNFHPTVWVEILPRMTDDFNQKGIPQRVSLLQLSQY